MFSNSYKPIINGVVRSMDLYRQGLLNAGHFVALFTSDAKGYDDDEPFIFRYPAISIPTSLKFAFPVVVAPQITWLVPRLKLDIIHSHHPAVVGKEAMNFSRSEGIPLVFTFHTLYHEYTHYFGFEADFLKQLVRRYVGDYVRQADHIIAPSARVLELFPSYKIDQPVDILPTPVDMSLFPAPRQPIFSDPDRIQLIYVGRIAREKNLKFLLRAFARAVVRDRRLHLRLIGDGTDFDKIVAYAHQLRLGNRVEFVGAVPFSQIPGELGRADLFVFASTTETQGLVILEAMAAGLPLVLVDSPALLDCARPDIDCLATPAKEDVFAEAICALTDHPERARAMGQAARINAKRYDIPALTKRLLDIYQNTIDKYHRIHRQ